MSKKTKKLEKENDAYKRKHEALNQNIFKLAEERTKLLRDLDDIRKKNDKLTSIIGQMQQQGRGLPQGMQKNTAESGYAPTTMSSGGDADGTTTGAAPPSGINGSEAGELEDGDDEASEYEYDEDEEEVSEGDDFDDDDTEEELLPATSVPPPTYGPERPPNPPNATATATATVNGFHD